MNHELPATDELVRFRIDALVCGELADDERQKLLTWLDEDMSRWRACGLAFLEGQLWEQALQAEGSVSQVLGCEKIAQRPEASRQAPRGALRSGGRRWLTPLLVVAASTAAFVCGLAFQELRPPRQHGVSDISKTGSPAGPAPAASAPLVATVPFKAGPLGKMEAALQIPVRTVESARSDAAGALSSVPESVRRHWERRGYELVEERRYLPARLPDGRQVMVPVHEVKMKFVGKPVS